MKRASILLGAIALGLMAGCGTTPRPSATPASSGTPDGVTPSPAHTPPPASTATPDPWAALSRPLQLPSLASGEECPTTTSSTDVDGIGPALGDGPIYPAFVGADGIFSLGIGDPANEPMRIDGRDWWGKKTLWLSDDTYRGIALVRGGRLDRDGEVLFYPGSGPAYVSAMRLTEEPWVHGPSTPTGWREWNSGVFVTEPGCYAYQIDGEDFTTIVVVEATAADGTVGGVNE